MFICRTYTEKPILASTIWHVSIVFKNGKLNLTSIGGDKYRSQVRTFVDFCVDPGRAFSGTVQSDELEFLQELVSTANTINGPIIEIGTLFGFTTQHIANCKAHRKELITVDDFSWNPIGFDRDTHRDFTNRVLYYVIKQANTTLFTGSNTDFYSSYSGDKPSMVFIDASHRYQDVITDISWALDNDIPIISGHDYSDNFPGVTRAVNKKFGGEKFQLVGSVWSYSN